MKQRAISAPGEHRLALAGLAENDRVVALVGEPVEDDRRAARPRPPVEVAGRLVQVRRRMQERRREARAVEVALADRALTAGPGRADAQASPMRSVADVDLDAEAPSLEPDRLEPLGQRGSIGRLEEQDRVDEVDPPGAGGDRPAGGDRGRVEPLALDIGDLASLGGQPLARPDDPQARRHERHRLGAVQRTDAHRCRREAVDGEQAGEPARPDLGRPAAPEMERRDERRAPRRTRRRIW